MALYLIGDVQGCDAALQRLLQRIDFSPSRDRLWLLGDLVNRGPDSLAVLRRVQALQGSVQCLLGNHDLHLLALASGARRPQRGDTLEQVLAAPDAPALLDWLRCQPLAALEQGALLVHAGVLPQWTTAQTLELAGQVQAALRAPEWGALMAQMYGNRPARWRKSLTGMDRLRVIINALTRLRFCSADGVMDFGVKEGADAAPAGTMPWFDVPGRKSAGMPIVFGHWSTLGWLGRNDVFCLDSGCVWGGCLTALRWGQGGAAHERITVPCVQAQPPC